MYGTATGYASSIKVFYINKFQVASVQRGRLESFQPPGHRKDRQELKQENEIAAEMAIDSETLGSVFDCEKGDYDY